MSDTTPTEGAVRSAYFMLSITAFCWGLNAIFGQLAIGEVSPMAIVTARWVGVVLLMTMFWHGAIRADWPVLKTRLKYLFLMGCLGFTGFNSLFYVASHTTSGLNVGIIQGAMPAFTFVMAYLAYRTKVTWLQIAGAVLTMIGVLMVASGGSFQRLLEFAFARGDVLMVIAGIFYSAYAVGLRNKPDVSAMSMFAVMAMAAFLASLPLLAVEIGTGHFQWPTPKGWLVVGLITLLPSFLAQVLFIKSVGIIGPGRAGIFFNLTPIITPILAVLFLQEKFELYHGLAIALVLGGIAVAELGKPKR